MLSEEKEAGAAPDGAHVFVKKATIMFDRDSPKEVRSSNIPIEGQSAGDRSFEDKKQPKFDTLSTQESRDHSNEKQKDLSMDKAQDLSTNTVPQQ